MAESDPRLRALAHPVRLRMLSLMWGEPMSAAELSRELGISHALASHHLRCLDDAGLAELADVRVRRGGRERRYRAAGGTPLTEQRDDFPLLAEALAGSLRERAGRRRAGEEGVTADAELWVEPELWHDVRRRILAAVVDLHDGAAAPHTPGTIRVGATVAAFPLMESTGPGGR
ncbi:winged helix-turn-helix domain-containing protein [Microbispora sp. NPDC088329]|uniref:ArsR/SmtB family transcription factor n=1 Tax=unclassified Microbispora TaxID=2614687 RepID=UPI003437B58D